jgi:hypothetical protein
MIVKECPYISSPPWLWSIVRNIRWYTRLVVPVVRAVYLTVYP